MFQIEIRAPCRVGDGLHERDAGLARAHERVRDRPSGTGSIVAEQLVRLGVGEIILIDFDKLE